MNLLTTTAGGGGGVGAASQHETTASNLVKISNVLRELKKEEIAHDLLNNQLKNFDKEKLNELHKLYESIAPNPLVSDTYADDLNRAQYHVFYLMNYVDKEFFNFTYKSLKESLDEIIKCSYWQSKCINLNAINLAKYIQKLSQ